MLSSEDLETLIAAKKREIEKEKTLLGLAPPRETLNDEQLAKCCKNPEVKAVNFKEQGVLCDHNAKKDEIKAEGRKELYELDENIPPDLERYIRRYCGLPVMLKAGEYSPNNPLARTERVAGDALLGLGEYERRRNTLRKIRQAQYREYLDQQAKKKQEAKEQAEKERREREEKERQREERERQLLLEREKYSPERRRASVSGVTAGVVTKVDTGVQVDRISRPLSVAVQTDDAELYRLPPAWVTAAERELSPRAVPPAVPLTPSGPLTGPPDPPARCPPDHRITTADRRRSYGDFDERTCSVSKCNRDKLLSDLRHSYMPSIFDADAIQHRNTLAEKEAAERRLFYQQELKHQIMEQQRIREERKNREKMLEQAEMRRLEEQLRMLKMAQEMEIDKQHHIDVAMNTNAKEYESKRNELQMEIDLEQDKLRTKSQPTRNTIKRRIETSKSDSQNSKLPFFYPDSAKTFQPIEIERERKPYSFNIPDSSIFSNNYDVDSYLRKNLNFKEKSDNDDYVKVYNDFGPTKQTIVETALIHEPKENSFKNTEKRPKIDASDNRNKTDLSERRIQTSESPEKPAKPPDTIEKRKFTDVSNKIDIFDDRAIPLLRHSSNKQTDVADESSNMSDAMKTIDSKWKVPAVQKNILKSLPNEEGKNISILTQLGSIRRQLQLEQLKLDQMNDKT